MSHHQQQILINGNGTSGLQTLQHYLVNNHIPNKSDQSANVHVQIVKQEQAQQRFIINRQYGQQTQNVQTQIIQHQPEIQVYWLLVEIESNNGLNSYSLVESKDVHGCPLLETLSTGNMVTININGKTQRATVVMASGDRNFIYAEYSQLNKMAEENLNLKLRDGQQVRNVKRRRISKDVDDDSSLSGWSGVSQNINTERIMSPSSNLQQKRVEQQRYIPPMLFDQGTQTDKRMTSEGGGLQDQIHELQKLIELSEHVLNEQKALKNEAKMSRLLVESFSDEFSAMRKSMQTIENKVDGFIQECSQLNKVDIVAATSGSKKKILNGSGTAPFFIIEHQEGNASENASLSLNGSNLEYTVEEIEGDDSGRSASRMSYHDQTSMMSNTSMDFKKEPFRRSHSSSNFSINSTSSTPIARSSSNSNLIDEWAEAEGEVMIGSNKTMVPVHVLRAIDWKNYKTATRKLLITLFTRETLATRSLTGRPSPAFHDRNKPVKGKLDQNIINDIIQVVTRKSSVQESQVRTAITTKCADENKMLRNRKDNEEKEKFKTPTSKTPIDNKENVVEN